jgi:hypothetical protein
MAGSLKDMRKSVQKLLQVMTTFLEHLFGIFVDKLRKLTWSLTQNGR